MVFNVDSDVASHAAAMNPHESALLALEGIRSLEKYVLKPTGKEENRKRLCCPGGADAQKKNEILTLSLACHFLCAISSAEFRCSSVQGSTVSQPRRTRAAVAESARRRQLRRDLFRMLDESAPLPTGAQPRQLRRDTAAV